jgi:hypothetical protein
LVDSDSFFKNEMESDGEHGVVAESAGELAVEALAGLWPDGNHQHAFRALDRGGQEVHCGNQIGPAMNSLAGTPSRVPR